MPILKIDRFMPLIPACIASHWLPGQARFMRPDPRFYRVFSSGRVRLDFATGAIYREPVLRTCVYLHAQKWLPSEGRLTSGVTD
jgi:hypothetical protein